MEEKRYGEDCSSCKPIKGIKCNVQNCYYHEKETDCVAGQIAVGPHGAECSSETSCVTFKPKED